MQPEGVDWRTKIGHYIIATIIFCIFIIPLLLGGAGWYGKLRRLHYKLYAHPGRNAGFLYGLTSIVAISVLLPLAGAMQFMRDSSADPYISIPTDMAIIYFCLPLGLMGFLASDLQRE